MEENDDRLFSRLPRMKILWWLTNSKEILKQNQGKTEDQRINMVVMPMT